MNHPCEKQQVIDMIYTDQQKIKTDVEKLVQFRTSALAIIATITVGAQMLAFLLPMIISWLKK
jgi:hypothetical protein